MAQQKHCQTTENGDLGIKRQADKSLNCGYQRTGPIGWPKTGRGQGDERWLEIKNTKMENVKSYP